MLPAAEAAGSVPLRLVHRNQFAVPVRVEVCVPAASVTEIVAVFVPATAVRGLNCTVTTRRSGASVVRPKAVRCRPVRAGRVRLTKNYGVSSARERFV